MDGEKKSFNIKHLSILTLALVILLFSLVGATLSRYVSESNATFTDGDIIYDHLDFTVNSVFEVRNQTELFAAINQGYSFIRLSDDIENPLIVTQKAETLDADLILDLNGIEIQRNGYEPILNIKSGVRLTVVDTSEEGTGGLYNPVGSVFNINGGTLTIATGHFESGPRYSEYFSYNTEVVSTSQDAKKTIVELDPEQVIFHSRSSGGGYEVSATITEAPIIKSYPQYEGDIVYTHGNLYFDKEYTGGDLTIPVDTYCYYRTSKDVIDEGQERLGLSCNWYYTYWVDQGYNYLCAGEAELADFGLTVDDAIEIAIYGYENVIKHASTINETKDYYAAIQMSSGSLEVQNGSFYCYFGLPNTACVNSTGGTINVVNGQFSSRIPNANSTKQNGNLATNDNTLMEKEDDTLAFGQVYFDRYRWNVAEPNGALAMAGEAYCILNKGNATLKIDNGEFYSSNNNNAHMNGGSLNVGGGSFTKQQNIKISASVPTAINDKTACIYMEQGTMNIGAAKYVIDGQFNTGIHMVNGELSVDDGDIYITGDGTVGILMTDGVLAIDFADFDIEGDNSKGIQIANGTLNIEDGDFEVIGENAKGIEMKNGNLTVTDGVFTLTGSACLGIQMTDGELDVFGATLSLTGESSHGIEMANGALYIEGGTFTLNGDSSRGIVMNNGQFDLYTSNLTLNGFGAMGIYSTVTGVGKFNITDTNLTLGDLAEITTNGTGRQVGIYAANGQVKLDSTDPTNNPCTINITSDSSTGIYALDGGSVLSTGYQYRLTKDNSTGIYSSGGSVQMTGGNITLDGNLNCHGIYAISVGDVGFHISLDGADVSVGAGKPLKAANTTYRACTGVTLMTDGDESDISSVSLTNANITCHEVGASLCGGKLDFYGTGSIKTSYASAVAVADGDITFAEGSNYTIVSNNTRTDSPTNSYTIQLPLLIDAVTDNRYVDYQNTDGIYVSGGNFVSEGVTNITHTGLQNVYDQATYYYNTLEVTSYAVRVVGGNVTITKATIENKAGGGVCCSSIEGGSGSDASNGNIFLGTEGGSDSDISVLASGQEYYNTAYDPIGYFSGLGGWQCKRSITGGHAIELNGGNITVYNGNYVAYYGNGIAANGRGTIDVYGGNFDGKMTYKDTNSAANGYRDTFFVGKSGPGAYYGLKVIGGAVVNIYGGIFNGGNGGAFVTGIDTFNSAYDYRSSSGNQAQVYVYAGVFGDGSNFDAFNVYDYSYVVFGASGEIAGNTANDYVSTIVMNGSSASIATNPLTNGNGEASCRRSSTVNIYYGRYNKIHNSNATIGLYNEKLGYVEYSMINSTTLNDKQNNVAVFHPTTID